MNGAPTRLSVVTGLDYAVNRYYSSMWGGFCRRTRWDTRAWWTPSRFLSPDPSSPGNAMADPQNWNR
jgi:hypothetical protein